MGWDHSYMPSTMRYNRWETLQKANPSHQAPQKDHYWGGPSRTAVHKIRTPMDVTIDQGP